VHRGIQLVRIVQRFVSRLSDMFVLGLLRLPLPVQAVAATPSGIKLFSKVVFMKQGRRSGFSAEQKLDVWRRWKAGQTLHEIGRAFGKEHSSIRCLVSRHGGIAPAVRRRALLAGWLPVRRSMRLPNV
jgi:hypothetical protein